MSGLAPHFTGENENLGLNPFTEYLRRFSCGQGSRGCKARTWLSSGDVEGAGGRSSGHPAYSQGVSWALAPVCPPGSLERPRSPVGHGAHVQSTSVPGQDRSNLV